MNTALVIAARDRRGLSPTQRHVLLVMATHAENYHPSVQQLADGTGLCVRSIQRALQGMEDAGAVRAMSAKDGSQGVVRYAFIVDGGSTESHPPPTQSHPPPDTESSTRLSKNKEERRERARATPPDGFDEFWNAYPRKVAIGDAEAAFVDARRIASQAEIMAGLARYCADREGKEDRYTVAPAKWLKGRRWADEIKAPSKESSHGKPHRLQQSAGTSSAAFFAAGVRASLGCLD